MQAMTGEVDGIIGDNTRTAIRQYQTSQRVFPADGRAGQKFYRLIMANSGNMSSNTSPTNRSSVWQSQTPMDNPPTLPNTATATDNPQANPQASLTGWQRLLRKVDSKMVQQSLSPCCWG